MTSPSPEKHLIFGAGLIGGFVAGNLLAAGFDVAVVARPKMQAAWSQGIQITDYLNHKAFARAPRFIDSNDSLKTPSDTSSNTPEAANFLWLTVKCTAVESALDEIARLIDANTVIICCQNGLGSDAPLRKRFANNKIIGSVVGFNVAELSPGHLHRSTEGTFVIENDAQIAPMISRLDSPLLPCLLTNEFSAHQWAKLQLNLVNPVNALSNQPLKAILELRGYRQILAALQRELLAVTDAKQISLPKLTVLPPAWLPSVLDLPDLLFRLTGKKMLAIDPSARTSMCWDLRGGKPTEIDFLSQAVVDGASQAGLDAPLNRRIVRLVHEVENGERKLGMTTQEFWQALREAE